MTLIGRLHGRLVHRGRVRVLCDALSGLLPDQASVLDVGCGDGLLSGLIAGKRNDINVSGIDVLVRDNPAIPIKEFDGTTIPFPDKSFDIVMFVDVLHHTVDPTVLLKEAARVATKGIVIKDHLREGLLANTTLRFMDFIGNAPHGVALPYNYWTRKKWHQAFDNLGLTIKFWNSNLSLYPAPASWFFDRSLHFLACLCPQ